MKIPGSFVLVNTEKDKTLKVVFEKLTTRLSDLSFCSATSVTVFGIRCYVENEAGAPCEECSLPDISTNEKMVEHLIEQLVENGVTPVHFKDIVEDAVALEYSVAS